VALAGRDHRGLTEEARAPEFNQFTIEMCRAAGFTPTVHEGTVESIRAAAGLVARGRCLYCVPSSCISALPGTIWRPLTEPASAIRGRYCGAPPTPPTTCTPSSAAHKPCPAASADSSPQARQCTDRSGYGASSGVALAQGCY
jgi:hypothetical protein